MSPSLGREPQVLWPQWCWAGVAGRKWPLSVPHLTEYDNSTEIQILHLLLKKYKEKGRRGRNGKLLYLFVCIADVFPDVVRVCSFFYDIWESPVCWATCRSCLFNASVSHIPICKIQVVKHFVWLSWSDRKHFRARTIFYHRRVWYRKGNKKVSIQIVFNRKLCFQQRI